ncbi:hypothetical protein T492DRAFT_106870 [Pavlovales sp. CCMP2436]|nr:hypothetical protein T492DRAFT_106870 [Pavlovales sp. CCMP2436]
MKSGGFPDFLKSGGSRLFLRRTPSMVEMREGVEVKVRGRREQSSSSVVLLRLAQLLLERIDAQTAGVQKLLAAKTHKQSPTAGGVRIVLVIHDARAQPNGNAPLLESLKPRRHWLRCALARPDFKSGATRRAATRGGRGVVATVLCEGGRLLSEHALAAVAAAVALEPTLESLESSLTGAHEEQDDEMPLSEVLVLPGLGCKADSVLPVDAVLTVSAATAGQGEEVSSQMRVFVREIAPLVRSVLAAKPRELGGRGGGGGELGGRRGGEERRCAGARTAGASPFFFTFFLQ